MSGSLTSEEKNVINPDLIGVKVTHNADNGCLGDFGRGRTHMTAILVGKVSSTFNPAVSEWGNPPAFSGKLAIKIYQQ